MDAGPRLRRALGALDEEVKCHACNHQCRCPKVLHTGEGKVQVPLTRGELEYLLAQDPGRGPVDLMALYGRLERALDLLKGSDD